MPNIRPMLCAAFDLASRNWRFLSGLAAVAAFAVATTIQIYSLRATIEVTKAASEITLLQSLLTEFKQTEMYSLIEESIVLDETLYAGKDEQLSGSYTWKQLNGYFGFFEQLGYYEKVGVIDFSSVDFMFGGAIIEAYLDPDVREYVRMIRSEGGQEEAFVEFQRLAEVLVDESARQMHVVTYFRGYKTW